MPLLPAGVSDLVRADGLPRLVTADDASQHVVYLAAGVVRSMFAADWPPPLPADPTPEQSAAGALALAQAATQAQADAAALRQKIVTVAASAVGQPIDTLTAAQVRALVACLLYKAGALDKSGVVQPLKDWL